MGELVMRIKMFIRVSSIVYAVFIWGYSWWYLITNNKVQRMPD